MPVFSQPAKYPWSQVTGHTYLKPFTTNNLMLFQGVTPYSKVHFQGVTPYSLANLKPVWYGGSPDRQSLPLGDLLPTLKLAELIFFSVSFTEFVERASRMYGGSV